MQEFMRGMGGGGGGVPTLVVGIEEPAKLF